MRMEAYRNFTIIVECGSISKAAKLICITQPALSNQIKALETMYRAPLIRHGSRQLELTKVGRILYDRAKTICRIEDETKQEVFNSRQTEGTLNIGISSDLLPECWKQLLQGFDGGGSSICFNIYDNTTQTLFSLLRNSIIEIGLIQESPPLPHDMEVHHTTRENPVVVTLHKNPWFAKQQASISISDLKDVPLCLARSYVEPLTDLCLKKGFTPNIKCVSTSQQILMDWVEQGRAAAFVHLSHLTEFSQAKTCCRPIFGKGLESQRKLISMRKGKISPIAERFIEYASTCQALRA